MSELACYGMILYPSDRSPKYLEFTAEDDDKAWGIAGKVQQYLFQGADIESATEGVNVNRLKDSVAWDPDVCETPGEPTRLVL